MKSIREIGNLFLNRINLLGMLQRAFNSRGEKKKKIKPSSLLYPRRKALLWLRQKDSNRVRGGGGGGVKAHLLFTLYLHEIVYHLFTLFSFSRPCPLPLHFPRSLIWFLPAHFSRYRWQPLRTISFSWRAHDMADAQG